MEVLACMEAVEPASRPTCERAEASALDRQHVLATRLRAALRPRGVLEAGEPVSRPRNRTWRLSVGHPWGPQLGHWHRKAEWNVHCRFWLIGDSRPFGERYVRPIGTGNGVRTARTFPGVW